MQRCLGEGSGKPFFSVVGVKHAPLPARIITDCPRCLQRPGLGRGRRGVNDTATDEEQLGGVGPSGHRDTGDTEQQMHAAVQDRHLEHAQQLGLGMMAGEVVDDAAGRVMGAPFSERLDSNVCYRVVPLHPTVKQSREQRAVLANGAVGYSVRTTSPCPRSVAMDDVHVPTNCEVLMSTDAIVLLKNDHKEIRKLFRDFRGAGPNARVEKGRIVDDIIEALTVHTYIENEGMYPEVRDLAPDLEDDILESYEEHHVADVLVVELAAMKPDDERFDAKTTVLIENVEHHIEEEEQEWFPKVREELGRKQLREMGARMLELRDKAPRSPAQPSALKKTVDAVIK